MPRDESLFPVDQRIYFQTLFGNRDAISEKDFSARELKAIKGAVKANMARTGSQTKGNVKYEDYPDAAQAGPGYVPIETTLGRFNYRVNPDKSITATDRYDFLNDERQANVQRFEQMSPMRRAIQAPVEALGQFFTGRPRTALGTLGEAFIGRDGREIRVEIPPEYKQGGSVRMADGGSMSLADYFKANLPVPMLEGEGQQLRSRFPQTYGALAGLLGTPPDEMAGSVLEPGYAERKAGADKTFALGTLLQMLPMAPATKGMPVGAIIRNTGDNNFLKGSVENALSGLKRNADNPSLVDLRSRLAQRLTDLGLDPSRVAAYSDADVLRQAQALPEFKNLPMRMQLQSPADTASNKFVEGPLTRYVKQQMATPEDPVRALAEQGVLHAPFEQQLSQGARYQLANERGAAGFPPSGVATSPLAKRVEEATDQLIRRGKASHYQGADYLKDDPWLASKAPDAPVFQVHENLSEDLGFTHLTDELRNALNPESGLPRNLLLTPEKLQNMGMERAVRHVAAINDWREQAALTARKAIAEGIPVRKEHEGGFRWLSVPDTAKDEKALKFACDVGKQGAWCTQGADAAKRYGSEGNRLHVLVDAKGDPHVQIMTSPEIYRTWKDATSHLDPKVSGALFDQFQAEGGATMRMNTPEGHREFLQRQSQWADPPERIVQIKRKANLVNSDPYEYRPFVQDFVKSGKWSDVGDIENTGLLKASNQVYQQPKNAGEGWLPRFNELNIPEGYYTNDELVSHINAARAARPGFATGGRVSMVHPAAAIQPLVRVPGFDR